MPRSKDAEAVIGFIGNGEVKAKNVKALLEDFTDGKSATFVFPVTKELWNETLEAVADFADSHEISYQVLTDDTTEKLKGTRAVVRNASKTIKSANPVKKMLKILSDAPSGTLVIAWDDDDETAFDALEQADEAEVVALDLTAGLDPLKLEEDDDEETDDEAETDDEDETSDEAESDDEEESDDEPASSGTEIHAKSDLESKPLDELKQIADQLGLELPPRTRTKTYVQAILDAQSGEDDGDENEVAGSDDEETEPISVKPGETITVNVGGGGTRTTGGGSSASSVSVPLTEDAQFRQGIVSVCPACGGPITATNGGVGRWCAPKCIYSGS